MMPEDALRTALDDLKSLAHYAIILLERRVADGTATEREAKCVELYSRALTRMHVERRGIFDQLAEDGGIVAALHALED
jgi:hypothetical protein